MLTTIFEDKYLEGKTEGIAKGKAEGQAVAIINILKTRFKRQVPESMSHRILAIRDSIVLASLTELAITCESFKDFSEDL